MRWFVILFLAQNELQFAVYSVKCFSLFPDPREFYPQIVECNKRPKNRCQKSPPNGFMKRLKSMSFRGLYPLDCPWTPPGALKQALDPMPWWGSARLASFAMLCFATISFFSQQWSGISVIHWGRQGNRSWRCCTDGGQSYCKIHG